MLCSRSIIIAAISFTIAATALLSFRVLASLLRTLRVTVPSCGLFDPQHHAVQSQHHHCCIFIFDRSHLPLPHRPCQQETRRLVFERQETQKKVATPVLKILQIWLVFERQETQRGVATLASPHFG